MKNRDHIGIFGKMNAGKSCIMNLLTQQKASIVDDTPGTTADTKISLKEIHGIGPAKIFDTAGLDEVSTLGEKKRKKGYSVLKECDLILLVINPDTEDISTEKQLIEKARELDKQLFIIYNLFSENSCEEKIKILESKLPLLQFHKHVALSAIDKSNKDKLLDFILKNYIPVNYQINLLPFIQKNEFYVLNIPMDEETPSGRFLRPQSMCTEYITRNWAYPVPYRMSLSKARNNDKKEINRFNSFINNFRKKPHAVITDSQALDVMKDWIPEEIELTSFSIMMINYMSYGRLSDFVYGIKQLQSLKTNDKVLIVEACNHSRIGEDIGTVQIPKFFKTNYPGVKIDFNFGREFKENDRLSEYKLIIHCGGCMITQQKLSARLRDLSSLGIPYTNYGIFLAYINGKDLLKRVLKVWNLNNILT